MLGKLLVLGSPTIVDTSREVLTAFAVGVGGDFYSHLSIFSSSSLR